MPKFSYFQQIVNRTQSASDRPTDKRPILNPTRPLFRQWEAHQPLVVEDTGVRFEEPSLPSTFESTGLSRQDSLTPVKTAPIRRPEQPLENPLAFPVAASPTPTPSPSGHSEVESLPQDAGEIAPPLAPQVPAAISPLRSPPAKVQPQPALPSTASTPPLTPNTLRAIPTDVAPTTQRQSNTPLVSDQSREKFNPITVEMPSAPSVMPKPVGNGELLERSQGKLQQPKDALSEDALSKQGNRSTMRPMVLIPSKPLSDQRLQQGTILPHPQPATSPLRTTLEPPPPEDSSRSTDISDIPNRWVEPGNGSSKRQENTVHIGSIDVHIMPPPVAPVQPTKPAVKSSPSPLSRGFTSSFGLRQG